MKSIFLLLTIILLSTTVRADYEGYHFQIELETINGKNEIGFIYLISIDLDSDSLNNTDYINALLKQNWKEENQNKNLVYFKERVNYEYREVGDSLGEKMLIYSLFDEQTILSKEIKSITFIDLLYIPYSIGITNPISLSDTIWMNKEPLSSYHFSGYNCNYQVFIHKNSETLETIIKDLKTKQVEINEADIDYIEGYAIDQQLWQIIEELFKEKVIIIGECTC